ncbi:MAG: ATPase, T2SS/T4P/T4SS family [Candidatus Helarchaeota archaeon]
MELDAHFILETKVRESGKEDVFQKVLTCDCINCNYLIPSIPLFSNPNCLCHCLTILNDIKEEVLEMKIDRRTNYYILDRNNIYILKNLTEKIKIIKNELNKHNISDFLSNNSCENYENCLKRINNFVKNTIGKNLINIPIFKNPIKIYKEFKLEITIIENLNVLEKCKKCNKNYLNFLKNAIINLNDSIFIKKYLKFEHLIKNKIDHNSLKLILGDIFVSKKIENKENITEKHLRQINEYNLFPFHIIIYENANSIENFYKVESLYKNDETRKVLNWIENKLKSIDYGFSGDEFLNLNDSLNQRKNLIKSFLDENFDHLNPQWKQFLIYYATFKTTGFLFLFPFLIDDSIEEIFIDRPNTEIYIDHREFGRCKTNIILSENELKRFITIIRIESNMPLDEMHPSLKAEIITEFFQVRATIIINPLSTDGYILIIRKMRKKDFSLTELIKNGTISVEAAGYLLFNLYHKRNIVVIGPPGSGKTTLINSLDILTPNHWRKMYIEDVIESIDQSEISQHQIRISVKLQNNFENLNFSKEFQVREALHRTPDMIYLGEIINSSSVNAFFFLLKVGLRSGLSTSHGETPELIVKRWMIEDQISINSIKDLDIIVQLARVNDVNKIKRRVIKISELEFDDNNNYNFISFFKRNALADKLENLYNKLENIYNKSPVINKIKNSNIEPLDFDSFYNEISFYIFILTKMLENEILDNSRLNKILNKYWILNKKKKIKDWGLLKKLMNDYMNQTSNEDNKWIGS